MRAVLCKDYGPPESLVLEDIESPTAGENDVVIKIHNAAVNYPDVLVIQNLYQIKPPLPFSPGGEVSGEVIAAGANVDTLKVGDREMAVCGTGGFRDEIALPAALCMPIPDSMDFILGKSNVEYLESLPLVEVELALNKPVNRFIKRGFDLSLAIPCFALLWPLVLLAGIKRPNGQRFLEPLAKYKWHNRSLFLLGVLYGHYSWVGSILPVQNKLSRHSEEQEGGLKPGITGLVQLNQGKLQEGQDAEHYQLYYMQNYSLGMDMDILLKSIFQPLDNWE